MRVGACWNPEVPESEKSPQKPRRKASAHFWGSPVLECSQKELWNILKTTTDTCQAGS